MATTIGRTIGRFIPRPIGRVLLRLCRRFAPSIYADATERARVETRAGMD